MAACAGCGSEEQVVSATQPASDGARTVVEAEEFGTCLVTEEPWDLDPKQRVGFCVASPREFEESYVSCVTFTDDLSVPPDDVEFHGNNGRLEETNIATWETEGCERALPAARAWLESEIAEG